jgi:prevent-host-death family protein
MQSIPLSEVRAHLAETLQRIEQTQEPVLISRRGQAKTVLLSLSQFNQLSAPANSFQQRLVQWRGTYLHEAAGGETGVFEGLRDAHAGREFSW